tara:strand:- start:1844 stop:2071 length:228 start_codon:yes stop_codon:yes gene_type:complete
MMKWLLARLREPTTYSGLALVVAGVGNLAKINEAPAIAQAIEHAGAPLSSGDWTTGTMLILGGVLAATLREKGKS